MQQGRGAGASGFSPFRGATAEHVHCSNRIDFFIHCSIYVTQGLAARINDRMSINMYAISSVYAFFPGATAFFSHSDETVRLLYPSSCSFGEPYHRTPPGKLSPTCLYLWGFDSAGCSIVTVVPVMGLECAATAASFRSGTWSACCSTPLIVLSLSSCKVCDEVRDIDCFVCMRDGDDDDHDA